MSPSIQLGRVGGVRVGVNWSWLVVFALISWSLTVSVFPDQNPGLGDGTYLAMGLTAAVLFFASILAHELGHALQARREGMEIDGITLWLFGGVARFKGMFESAGSEFRIAIAGPVVSLLVGVAAIAVSALVALPTAVDGVVAWLGWINVTVLVFNLLPALPLDGGRMLRSGLWAAKRDFRWATRVAATIGRGFGYALIGLGLFLAIAASPVSGLWLAFIGWFLLTAATAEARFAAVRDALGDERVGELMVRDPAVVAPDLTIGELMDDVVSRRRFTTYPVVEDGRAVGLLPFRCVAEVPRREWDERRLRDCMLPLDEVPRLHEDERVVDALVELADGVGRGLVVDADGRLVGLLSATDVARVLELGGVGRRG